MNSRAAARDAASASASDAALPWTVALFGLALMYGPMYWDAAGGLWQTEEHGHGPLILAVVLWLFWTLRDSVSRIPNRPSIFVGSGVFVLGLLFYVVGRAFDVAILGFGSQILTLVGVLLLLKGPEAVRRCWFPLIYLVFLVPLPGTFVDAVTGPLKHLISSSVQAILFSLGYPIANTGVILTIGQFQLMVADACSGLNSMFSLSALGTLFMYVMSRKSLIHNALMLVSIVPIAFVANIVRVIILVLLTYHFGDEVGQGFLHGAAGMALMIIALLVFIILDAVLNSILRRKATRPDPQRN